MGIYIDLEKQDILNEIARKNGVSKWEEYKKQIPLNFAVLLEKTILRTIEKLIKKFPELQSDLNAYH